MTTEIMWCATHDRPGDSPISTVCRVGRVISALTCDMKPMLLVPKDAPTITIYKGDGGDGSNDWAGPMTVPAGRYVRVAEEPHD